MTSSHHDWRCMWLATINVMVDGSRLMVLDWVSFVLWVVVSQRCVLCCCVAGTCSCVGHLLEFLSFWCFLLLLLLLVGLLVPQLWFACVACRNSCSATHGSFTDSVLGSSGCFVLQVFVVLLLCCLILYAKFVVWCFDVVVVVVVVFLLFFCCTCSRCSYPSYLTVYLLVVCYFKSQSCFCDRIHFVLVVLIDL